MWLSLCIKPVHLSALLYLYSSSVNECPEHCLEIQARTLQSEQVYHEKGRDTTLSFGFVSLKGTSIPPPPKKRKEYVNTQQQRSTDKHVVSFSMSESFAGNAPCLPFPLCDKLMPDLQVVCMWLHVYLCCSF